MAELTSTADAFTDGSVTVADLAKEFGIKRSTAYELMNAGRLPWTRVYGRRLIPRRAVKELLATGLVGIDRGTVSEGSSTQGN